MPEDRDGGPDPLRPAPGAVISQLMLGYMTTHLVRAALLLDLPDRIGDTPRTGDELAALTGTHASSLTRLLRALAAVGLVRELEPDRFALTEAGRRLCRDAPDSLRAMAAVFTDESMTRAWWDLPESLRTGRPAFEEAFGADYYTHLAGDPELSRLFNEAHGQSTRRAARALVRAHDFTRASTIVDVGGGDGTLLAAILAAAPGARGILYDTAAGLTAASETLRAAGVADRCTIRPGDFLTEVPAGADRYLVKSTLHNWDDTRAATILTNCRRAMPDHARLLLVETVLPEVVDPAHGPFAYLSDLNMLVNLGGRERGAAELTALLAGSGLRVVASGALEGAGRLGLHLTEAVPIPDRRTP